MAADQPGNMEVVEIENNGLDSHLEPLYENARRILSLLSLLSGSDCTREDIFARMKDDYRVSENDPPKVLAPSGRAGKMLTRHLQALQDIVKEITDSGNGQPAHYSLVKAPGPFHPFFFTPPAVDPL